MRELFNCSYYSDLSPKILQSNVMVSEKGTPRLIDFGIFRTSNDPVERTGFETAILTSSLRWSAPEILAFDSPITSKSEKSDVYAFASTCIEVRNSPYLNVRL